MLLHALGGGGGRRGIRTEQCTLHVTFTYFFNKSRLHTLHAMWMYCNIRLGWRLRFNVNNSAYILCIMGLTSLFVQTIRHWQSFHISHRNAFKKKTSTDPTSNIKIICYVMHWFYMLFTLHPFLSSKAVEIKLKLIKYAMLNLPSKV